jgi:hypothetical protein
MFSFLPSAMQLYLCRVLMTLFTFTCSSLDRVPYQHGMACPQVADGGDAHHFWREAANLLNKQSRTADKGWSSSLGVEHGANNSLP